MTKQSGLGDGLIVGGFDLSGDVGSISRIGGGPEALEVTAINKSAKERLGGKRSGGIDFSTWFDPAAGFSHDMLSALPRTDTMVTYLRGQTVGNEAAACLAKQINYDGTRGEDGSFALEVETQSNGFGLEWGRQLTAGLITLSASATHNGTSIDNGAASTNGLTFYVQVGAYVTTLVSIVVQQSSDDGAGDAFADVAGSQVALTGSGGPAVQRVAVAGNLERYLRLQVSGAYTTVPVQAMVARREVATVF